MTLLLAWQPPRQAAPDRPPVEGNWGALHCHPARSRRVQASGGGELGRAALSPCAQSQGPGLRWRGIGARCTVTLRAVAGSRPPVEGNWGALHCHPARSRRVQASAGLIQRSLNLGNRPASASASRPARSRAQVSSAGVMRMWVISIQARFLYRLRRLDVECA